MSVGCVYVCIHFSMKGYNSNTITINDLYGPKTSENGTIVVYFSITLHLINIEAIHFYYYWKIEEQCVNFSVFLSPTYQISLLATRQR